jgi:2-succinyl-5-enolpyruvyl-6-hydroxy-3-cyclohexene-1-carboxylate synthase
MKTTDKNGISNLIQQCLFHGMNHIVCSPGSRNAPFIIAIDEHPDLNAIVIHDERSAAFYALGMALQLKEPVGIVCTSGSAMLNYYPAVAEAYYQCVPIVVISADRPTEWIDHGDGQTIVQTGVYRNHIRYEASIVEFIESDSERNKMNDQISDAFEQCNGNWKGPIHFNAPVSEPLYNTSEIEYNKSLFCEKKRQETFHFSQTERKSILGLWSGSEKKMIICGQFNDHNDGLLNRLVEISGDPSVVVLVENTSNLVSENFVLCIDRTLCSIQKSEVEEFQPDILISIGGAVISKRIKTFLRQANIKEHWKVGFEFPDMDTYKVKTESFQCDPSDFLSALLDLDLVPNTTIFGAKWKQKDILVQQKLPEIHKKLKFSDLKVFECLLKVLPKSSNLHMGNSSVVRYCQLFDPDNSVRYFSNRGTSGIDGCTSTACGSALMDREKLNVLISGDVSFFYDSNALWSNHLPGNLRVIVIHNNGGGIFKIIDGPSSVKQLDTYFEAHHEYSAEHLCTTFNVEYFVAETMGEIHNVIDAFFMDSENDRPKLLEINTPSEINDIVLKDFFNLAQSS